MFRISDASSRINPQLQIKHSMTARMEHINSF